MPPIVEETHVDGPRMNRLTCLQSFVPLVFAVAAIILGTAPSLQCETVQFTQVEGNNGLILLAGILSYRTRDASEWNDLTFASRSCVNYGWGGLGFDYDADAKTRTVLAFSILTPLLGSVLIIKSFLAAMCGTSRRGFLGLNAAGGWKCLCFSYLLTSVFQGLVLLIDSSSICDDNPAIQYLEATNIELAGTFPESCEWGAGFSFQIAAVALWVLAASTTFLIKDPVVIHEHPRQEQTVTYTQNLDGSAEETHIAVVKGAPVEPQKQ